MKLGLFLLFMDCVFMSWYFQSSLVEQRTKVELQSEIASQQHIRS